MFKLNDSQLKQLAEFLSNLSLIFIGTTIVAPIFANPRTFDLYIIIWGVALSAIFLILSLLILKKIKK